MKKLTVLVLALILCLVLVACGPDRQPAIDAFNDAKDAFNELANEINADIDSYDPEVVQIMNEMSAMLEEYRERLESSDAITQEELDAMIEKFADVEEWVKLAKEDLNDGVDEN